KLAVIRVPDVLDRLAEIIDGVEDELLFAPLGSNDHVVTQAGGIGEPPLNDAVDREYCHDEHHAQAHRDHRQERCDAPLGDAAEGDPKKAHAAAPALVSAILTCLISSSRSIRSNWPETSVECVTMTSE